MAKTSSRRDFFIRVGQVSTASIVGGALWGHVLVESKANAFALRPPGALPEKDFLATCIKCGQCVDACPYETLSLTKVGEDGEIGVPHFTAREIPCYMCEDVPCARSCPTGALDREIEINDSRMGLAVLIDQEACIAFQGLRCEVCYRQCPLIDKALTINYRPQERTGKHAFFEPVVHSDVCTGCGMCEQVCILEESAIRILPHKLAQGKLGSNYRLGWKEKTKISNFKDSSPEKTKEERQQESNEMLNNALDSLNDMGTLYD
ncbi:MAG: ferredoxin-type protein NapG [SAR324 cluster bacterium]|uniref:Ferredoxin-type protein NapG n=1 Tax=SAR324 cluster bacterium TaxID=2024889 RepID=A0A2A4T9L4_9DELT|nr:MAG: ferredoxin-type protein NapG [SAR324 cluster bacterium]